MQLPSSLILLATIVASAFHMLTVSAFPYGSTDIRHVTSSSTPNLTGRGIPAHNSDSSRVLQPPDRILQTNDPAGEGNKAPFYQTDEGSQEWLLGPSNSGNPPKPAKHNSASGWQKFWTALKAILVPTQNNLREHSLT
ncbi:hypothetical protein BC835DRAFT_729195 [Cytidiella melzeri]|nr:hypothetical protein BC835DRAFT_729195 [Cytidiella melzeri]